MTPDPFVIISTDGMHEMAQSVQGKLHTKGYGCAHHKVEYETFKNGEVNAHIPETVRRQHVFFFHPLLFPTPNEAFMRMLIVGDALARASVAGITLVIPFMSYLRQDRKEKNDRVPITARLIANLIESNRAIRDIITIDMHTDQAQGFFSIPVDNLSSKLLFVEELKRRLGEEMSTALVVSPDFGSAKRADKFAKALGGLGKSLIEKRRTGPNKSEVVAVIGEPVDGRIILMNDDMIDTAGTIMNAAEALLREPHNAKKAYIMATHGLFSADAKERCASSNIPILTTNSIPRSAAYLTENPWLTVVPIDDLIAEAIHQNTLIGGSVSKLS